jgi:hypothetical protein
MEGSQMKLNHPRSVAAGGAALFASAALAVALVPGSAVATGDDHHHRGDVKHAHLNALNNSGVSGHAKVKSSHRHLHVDVEARGLAKNLPHAQHIHYGEQARNECPTAGKDDANGDFRLTTAEGLPAYGDIAVSLTTRGDTSPASGLAVDRFPTAPRGKIDYDRTTKTNREVARAIRNGEGVVVIHGVDYNGNGTYDFDSAGASELDPSLPAEATDPAVCGVLR